MTDGSSFPGQSRLGLLLGSDWWIEHGLERLGGDNVATIELGIGSGLIVNDGVALNPTFGNFTITSAVPEPSFAAMLALGLLGSVVRRRRKTISCIRN